MDTATAPINNHTEPLVIETTPTEAQSAANQRIIYRKLEAIKALVGEITEYMAGKRAVRRAQTGHERPTAAVRVLTLLSAPGGLKRKQIEVAERLDLKIRTVAFAFKSLLADGQIVRGASNSRDYAKYSAVSRWEDFDALTGNDRLDEAVWNELQWRFGSKTWRVGLAYSTGIDSFVGCKREDLLASITRLVAAKRITLNAEGKIVKPAGEVVHADVRLTGGAS